MIASRVGSFAHFPPWDNQGASGKGSVRPSQTFALIKKTGNYRYIEAAGIRDSDKSPLFRSAAGRTGMLTEHAMNRIDAYRMIRRRASDAGFKLRINCIRSGPRGSRPIWKPAARWKMRRRWRRMKARAPPSSTIVRAIPLPWMRWSGLPF